MTFVLSNQNMSNMTSQRVQCSDFDSDNEDSTLHGEKDSCSTIDAVWAPLKHKLAAKVTVYLKLHGTMSN